MRAELEINFLSREFLEAVLPLNLNVELKFIDR